MENPKLKGSCIIDCIPQTGKCPNNCDQCFYNHAFYRTLYAPKIPSAIEAQGKMVRMNSGHDSNLQRDLVIATAAKYEHPYFNTSIPRLDFPGPVVLTVNGQNTDGAFHAVIDTSNLMAVRVRVNTWNRRLVDRVVRYYTNREVFVLMTWMRYFDKSAIKQAGYEWKQNILNPYYCLTDEAWLTITDRYIGATFITSCGKPAKLCKNCGWCVDLYRTWCDKVGKTCNLVA